MFFCNLRDEKQVIKHFSMITKPHYPVSVCSRGYLREEDKQNIWELI
jgi:hypothetical protein